MISRTSRILVPCLDGQNRQSPIASVQRSRSTLASHSAIHVEGMLNERTPIARFESRRNERKVWEDSFLCFRDRYDRQRTLAIRIATITLASDSATTIARFRPSKVPWTPRDFAGERLKAPPQPHRIARFCCTRFQRYLCHNKPFIGLHPTNKILQSYFQIRMAVEGLFTHGDPISCLRLRGSYLQLSFSIHAKNTTTIERQWMKYYAIVFLLPPPCFLWTLLREEKCISKQNVSAQGASENHSAIENSLRVANLLCVVFLVQVGSFRRQI